MCDKFQNIALRIRQSITFTIKTCLRSSDGHFDSDSCHFRTRPVSYIMTTLAEFQNNQIRYVIQSCLQGNADRRTDRDNNDNIRHPNRVSDCIPYTQIIK